MKVYFFHLYAITDTETASSNSTSFDAGHIENFLKFLNFILSVSIVLSNFIFGFLSGRSSKASENYQHLSLWYVITRILQGSFYYEFPLYVLIVTFIQSLYQLSTLMVMSLFWMNHRKPQIQCVGRRIVLKQDDCRFYLCLENNFFIYLIDVLFYITNKLTKKKSFREDNSNSLMSSIFLAYPFVLIFSKRLLQVFLSPGKILKD